MRFDRRPHAHLGALRALIVRTAVLLGRELAWFTIHTATNPKSR
jgi:hypothetical protein